MTEDTLFPSPAAELPDGTHAVAFQGALFQEPPFRELAHHYLNNIQGVRKRKQTLAAEASYLRQALVWLKERGYERPNTAQWQSYFDWRLSSQCPNPVTPSTVETHRATIRKVYKRCQEAPRQGWVLIPNPVTTAFLAPYWDASEAEPRAMADPIVTVPLIKAAMPDLLGRALVQVLDDQGLRIQEALGIPLPGSHAEREVVRRRCLDLDGATLEVRKQRERDSGKLADLKSGYSAGTVELQPASVEALREALRWRKEQLLVPRKAWRKGVGYAALNYVFPYYRPELDNLMRIHREVAPHDFRARKVGQWGGDAWHVYRHTFATWLARSDVDHHEIHRQLRHRDQKTTDSYLRALLAEVRGSPAIRDAMAKKRQMQEQAMAERSGRGLLLVKNRKGDRT